MISVGIDPGKSGAIVALEDDDSVLLCEDMPTLPVDKSKKDYNVPEMSRMLSELMGGDAQIFVVLERSQAMPKQGVTSTFKIGMGYGIWLGILGSLHTPYVTVRPAEWAKVILKGQPGKGKERSLGLVSGRLPNLPLVPDGCRAPRDGRADAACLALYGRRLL